MWMKRCTLGRTAVAHGDGAIITCKKDKEQKEKGRERKRQGEKERKSSFQSFVKMVFRLAQIEITRAEDQAVAREKIS